jgi:putative ABC transport system substrate-binding protein
MRRREFIILAGMTAASWSFAARAQQPKFVAKIGFLYPGPEPVAKLRSVPLLAGLASEGLREPKDFALITRATGGDMAKVPSPLDELLASKVDLLVISGPALTRAVHDAVKTLPIVTIDLEKRPRGEWLAAKLCSSRRQFDRSVFGLSGFSAKRLQLLREIVPGITKLVVLWDPSTPRVQQKALTAAAQSINVKTEVLELRSPSDFDAASARRPDGLLLLSFPLVSINSKRLAELTLQHRLPAISMFANFARAGGLISYGPNLDEFYVRPAFWRPRSSKVPNPLTCLPNFEHASNLLRTRRPPSHLA